MDFSTVKSITIPEGMVKELRIDGVYVWEKPSNYSVQITTDNTKAITGMKYLQSASVTFTANYNVPKVQQSSTATWTVSGLPSGMSAQSLNGDSLTVSGYPESTGNFTVTVGVTKGGYSDSKTYTLTVENVSYGVEITTNNASAITTFVLGQNGSLTFSADFNVPPQQQNNTVTWEFSGLPAGLSASGATVSGTATNTGTSTVTLTVTKGNYIDTKQYTITVYGLAISTTSLPSGYDNEAYSTTLGVTRNLPSGVGTLAYYASGLPSGLSLDSATGTISGTPSSTGNSEVSVYAEQLPYRSVTKSLSLSIYSRKPSFDTRRMYITLSIAQVCDSSYVGKYLCDTDNNSSWLIPGRNFDQYTTLDNNTHTYPIIVIPNISSTNTSPKIQIEIDKWSTYNLRVRCQLVKRYPGSPKNLKSSIASTEIYAANAYGTAVKDIFIYFG